MVYYTPMELAKMFNISYHTVLNMIRRSDIDAVKIGRQWRIPDEEVNRLKNREEGQ